MDGNLRKEIYNKVDPFRANCKRYMMIFGALNGMNKVMTELPDTIEAIVALLRG